MSNFSINLIYFSFYSPTHILVMLGSLVLYPLVSIFTLAQVHNFTLLTVFLNLTLFFLIFLFKIFLVNLANK